MKTMVTRGEDVSGEPDEMLDVDRLSQVADGPELQR
jgi:hypothetical protein